MSGSQTTVLTTGSRLHFGPLCWGDGFARRFGGLGLMIHRPEHRVEAEDAEKWSAEGPQAERVVEWARRAAGWFGERGFSSPPMHLTIAGSALAHRGLGSGTQLALAAARLVAHRAGIDQPRLEDLAAATGRGKRSGVGLHGFVRGGLIVEGGHPAGSAEPSVPPLLVRAEVPASWRVLVALPDSRPGLHGTSEARAFEQLPSFSGAVVDRLCGLVLLELLPAVMEDDLGPFGRALEEIQMRVGEAFAGVQGGRFASPAVEEVVHAFRREGLVGVGQSSWGPAVYGFLRHDPESEARTVDRLSALPGLSAPGKLFWTTASGLGARLEARDRKT